MYPGSRKSVWLAGAGGLILAAFGANAVKAADASPAVAASDDIVVTARRTNETLQRVPLSISAFSGDTLDKIGATDATSLQGLVPNLNIVQGRGSADSANIYIRGLGQPDALQTFDPAVGTYVDDVYISRIRGVLFNLFDLDHVEVLRGPQGTLYGKNTIGGAIRYITVKPSQTPIADVSVAAGNIGAYEVKATLMGPVTNTLALGASIYAAGHGDYVHDSITSRGYNNEDNLAGRFQLAWTPTSNFRTDVSFDYTHEDPHMTVGQETAAVYRINVLPPVGSGLGPITFLYPGSSNWNYSAPISSGLPNREPLNHAGISSVETWNIDSAFTLKSVTAYRRLNYDDSIDIDATPFELGDVIVGVTQRQFSQEFQLNYEHGPWKVVAGAFYMREHINSTQEAFGSDLYTFFGQPYPATRYVHDDLLTNSYAAYANAVFAITERLHLSGGLRFTDESKTYSVNTYVNVDTPATDYGFQNAHHTWTKLSPSASLDYQALDNVLVYARFAEGFQSGGYNGRAESAGQQTPYAPETVLTYEVGAKTSWLEHKVTANLALFYNDYRDFQASVTQAVPDPVQPNPPLIVQTVLNAGKLRTDGAELELAYHPITPLRLEANVGYLDAHYVTFTDLSFPGGSRAFQTPAFSPKYTARVGGAYEFPLNGLGSLTLGGGVSYRSRMSLAVDDTTTTGAPYAGLYQNGYALYDARLVWESANRKYTLGVYGENLGGEIYKTDAENFVAIAGIQTAYYGAPRTVLVRATAKFF